MYCRKWDSKKELCYFKARTRKMEADAKKIESDHSLLTKIRRFQKSKSNLAQVTQM